MGETKKLIEEIDAKSTADTAKFARRFAGQLRDGDVVAFYGNLGSGKTFIIQQICRFLKVQEPVTSPTFTIINEYHTAAGQPIYHFDFYRLRHDAELQNLGIEDYFYNENLCLIEWADKIETYLPVPRYEIYIDFVADEPGSRVISVWRIEG